MPITETVTIINKSGKVVSTGKQLLNIFKDAKAAYQDKKEELKYEHYARSNARSNARSKARTNAQRLVEAREETRSVASSHRSHRSRRSHRHRDDDGPSRPPLTEMNLSHVTEMEGSVISASSHRSKSSRHSHHRSSSPSTNYQSPYTSTELTHHTPGITRRHTDFPPTDTQLSPIQSTLPPNYSQLSRIPQRTQSNPDFLADPNIDMNLAYGILPPDLVAHVDNSEQEQELKATMSKLDELLMEAQCLHHTATAIMSNLQANPEAMAAVALTLAELSNLVAKMSPGILGALKTSSPAIFALLASPQFLIAGGVAMGVTVVMFGGYKIIKKIQADTVQRKEANRMEEAMVYDGLEMGSIESWRRGIAEEEARSVSTSVDGEFITPEAARQRKERIRERKREERRKPRAESVSSEDSETSERTVRTTRTARTAKTLRRVGSESTIRRKPAASVVAPSEAGSSRSRRTESTVSGGEKKKKPNALSIIFKKNKNKGKEDDVRSSTLSFRPKTIEL